MKKVLETNGEDYIAYYDIYKLYNILIKHEKDETKKDYLANVMYISFQSYYIITAYLQIFFVETPKKVFNRLGLGDNVPLEDAKKWGSLNAGIKIERGEALFKRYDIEEEIGIKPKENKKEVNPPKDDKHKPNIEKEEFEKIWCHYFDLDRDYGEIKSFLLKEDEKLREAVEKMWGVRILNQEFFETLISFIISQNKQIPHIKQIVARISHDYGKYQGSVGGIDFYGFPTPQQLSQADIDALRECKTGFRAPYIYNAVEFVNNEIIKEENLRKCGVDECREQLMKIKGVGMKVANCVSLFGLGYREAFPVDVWIKRIMQSLYFDGEEHSNAEIESYGVEHFGKYGGYAQQYLFYYGKSEKIGLKNKTN